MVSLTEQLDNLYTTTWQGSRDTVIDNIFTATPFFFWMRNGGRFETQGGGRNIQTPLRFAKSDNVAWITKGSTVPVADKEFLTVAQYDWRYISDTIVRFMTDEQKNRAGHEITSLVTNKLQNAEDSLVDTIETAIFAAQTGNVMNGLQDLVADDPTAAATIGSIPQSTNSWWRNKTKNMTGLSFATQGIPEMRTMVNNVSNNLNMDMPDIIVGGQLPYEYYEDSVLEQKQIVNKTLGDAGFQNIEFKGLPVIWSPACADTRMYFLNTRFLTLVYDPAVWFDMTDWKEPPNQVNDRVAQIVSAFELVTSRRQAQGIMHTIDTA